MAGIGRESENSLLAYLQRTGVQKHRYAHHLNSSWMLCANLYFPFRGLLKARRYSLRFSNVASPWRSTRWRRSSWSNEDADIRLRPSHMLGEEGGTRGANQTSPDLGLLVNRGRGLVLVENKLTEDSFYKCSAWKHKGSRKLPGNSDPDRCNNPLAVAKDYASQCHQHHPVWGRRYWDHLAPVVDEETLAGLTHCPAMKDGFQLLRQPSPGRRHRSVWTIRPRSVGGSG